MKKLLYSLILLLTAFATQAQTPAITMTTTKNVGSQFTIVIIANAENTPIQIDWGDGVKTNFTVGTDNLAIGYPVKGSTLKIWGAGIRYIDVSSRNLTSIDLSQATSLTTLFCKDNQLTTLNLASCTLLRYVECPNNSLTGIALPSTSTLTYIDCSNNLLTSLNVSGNPSLTELICHNNNLSFTSLPIKQPKWTNYTYSPQAKYQLSKKTYSPNEEIDLSSQLMANSVTTTYTWKTKGGQTLASGADYTASNGKFVFLKAFADSLFCEMANTTFPNLTLNSTSIAIPLAPSVIMTTTNAVGSTFSFDIDATVINTPIQVDWGNGVLTNYTVGTNTMSVSGKLAGSTIKVYGEGIAYLNLNSNKLTALDVSWATVLSSLNCEGNQLTTLDLSKNIALTYLNCSFNNLTTLDVSKSTALTKLVCYCNRLTTLHVSKNTALTSLDCCINQLVTLDVSENIALTELNCRSNELVALDVSKNTALVNLYCSSNSLAVLDVLKNTKLKKLVCEDNHLTFSTLPVKQASWTEYYYNPQASLKLSKKIYVINEVVDLSSQFMVNGSTTAYVWKTVGGSTLVKGVDYLEDKGKFTFLKEQGDYLFCQMTNSTFPGLTLTTETIFIPSASPAITVTTAYVVGSDFSFEIAASAENTPIQVDWGNGKLINYTVGISDMSVDGKLAGSTIKVYGMCEYLSVSLRKVTALDVSGATKLKRLYCSQNQLTSIDVSKNTALTTLYCTDNKLTTVDISKNSALVELNFDSNKLTSLDVSKNTALTTLICYFNRLTNLDVSKNTALTYLACGNNYYLATLDVSKNTALTILSCGNNKLTTLDVSKNTALTSLGCSNNQLTTLDVSKNTMLTSLHCYNNELKNIDVSKNSMLAELYCDSNKLIILDVSNNTALTKLDCSYNQLTFGTLPVKQTGWIKFSYIPQSVLTLPKEFYSISEAIDLSSQLTANGNTTAYVWKTKGGEVLVSGVDYTANNGVFTFIKTQPTHVYCEMTNASFPSLVLETNILLITQSSTSVEENEVKVRVSPNPVRDNLSIESAESIVRVEVFTVTGLKVYTIDGNNTNTMTLSVASCPKGLLIVKVYGRNGVMERKVIKD